MNALWLWAWMGITPGFASSSFMHAFLITKDQNQNLVQYDVGVTPDCRIDKSSPLDIYWLIFSDDTRYKRERLSFFEKGIYGLDYFLPSPRELLGEIRVLKNHRVGISVRIVLEEESGTCRSRAVASGKAIASPMELISIELKNFRGQSPQELFIQGRELGTGKEISASIPLR